MDMLRVRFKQHGSCPHAKSGENSMKITSPCKKNDYLYLKVYWKLGYMNMGVFNPNFHTELY